MPNPGVLRRTFELLQIILKINYNSLTKKLLPYPGDARRTVAGGPYPGVTRRTMAYYAVLWRTLAYGGVPWRTVAYFGVPRRTVAYAGTSYYIVSYRRFLTQDFDVSNLPSGLYYIGPFETSKIVGMNSETLKKFFFQFKEKFAMIYLNEFRGVEFINFSKPR